MRLGFPAVLVAEGAAGIRIDLVCPPVSVFGMGVLPLPSFLMSVESAGRGDGSYVIISATTAPNTQRNQREQR